MLSNKQAELIVRKNLPNGKIATSIEYGDLYVFQVFIDDPQEGGYDPYYSVNSKTKEFRDFSIITDGDMEELMDLFMEAQKNEGDKS